MHSTEFFTFLTAQATDVGRVRTVNEDSFLSRPESGLWVVADGMGGHAAGDFASQTIVRELYSVGLPGSADDFQARFMERLGRANDQILDHSAELNQGTIGATLVALLVAGQDYACIWSGDSRIYRLRAGELEQQTRDHTEVQALLDAGSITPEEAETWPRKNVITRAIGVSPSPECDVMGGRLALGDRFLLCSDGLTGHVSDAEIAEILADPSPQAACDQLIALTLERGARDNVTVIVLYCMAPPAPQIDDSEFDMDVLE
ncbi:PP2C family protein-serine/threonine phosphatase [Aliiroseovarius sp.]|uniref:PP2C family protein-serine/threonine phosphatase n=1 Tax=Aliiroseovarius sp. TaxID=1872442 RepID=UPI003BA8D50A